jgi:meso-butanediol dehydrogenase/(S,S)-butanediol dehydrogenase/diacetyl reductase
VNAICPGNIDTSMWFDHLSKSESRQRQFGTKSVDDTFAAVIEDHVPLGRAQTPADIAEAALYLTRAENVTGISLNVAGGFAMN